MRTLFALLLLAFVPHAESAPPKTNLGGSTLQASQAQLLAPNPYAVPNPYAPASPGPSLRDRALAAERMRVAEKEIEALHANADRAFEKLRDKEFRSRPVVLAPPQGAPGPMQKNLDELTRLAVDDVAIFEEMKALEKEIFLRATRERRPVDEIRTRVLHETFIAAGFRIATEGDRDRFAELLKLSGWQETTSYQPPIYQFNREHLLEDGFLVVPNVLSREAFGRMLGMRIPFLDRGLADKDRGGDIVHGELTHALQQALFARMWSRLSFPGQLSYADMVAALGDTRLANQLDWAAADPLFDPKPNSNGNAGLPWTQFFDNFINMASPETLRGYLHEHFPYLWVNAQ